MGTSEKIRIGAVNYLNTRPLVYGLADHSDKVELLFDLPSRLADGLAAGRYDVALIPSIEIFQDPTYNIVSNVCIGCRGPVLSVKLFSQTPVEQIRTLALDEGSRTSVGLVRILLAERYGIYPELRTLPIDTELDTNMLGDLEVDAMLLIGDRAMHSPPGRFEVVWDLGDQWCRWSGLPFVFAMWTARAGLPLDVLEPLLESARDEGLRHLEEIAESEAAALGLTVPQCVSYLRDNLNFYFGPSEQQGLGLFYEKSARLGLAPRGVDIGYGNCNTTR